MTQKGISPIIATVLLLAVTISVVGIFSNWLPNVATTVTDGVTDQTDQRVECNDASFEIMSANYDSGEVDFTIRNSGSVPLEDDLLAAAFDSNNALLGQEENITLETGTITNETVEVDDEPSYIEAYSTICGDTNSRLEQIN